MSPWFRFGSRKGDETGDAQVTTEAVSPEAITRVFAAPDWLQNLGRSAWLIVGVILVVLGLVWLLGETSSIVLPVISASIVAAVVGPVIGWLRGHGVPRGAGAALFMVTTTIIIVGVFMAIVGGIIGQASELKTVLGEASDELAGLMRDAGIDPQTVQSNQSAANAGTSAGVETLVKGLAAGVEGLSSLAMFVAFFLLSLFFLLKDGPSIRAWVERQVGIPPEMARGVTQRIIESLRGYFVGVTAIAVFNVVVVSLGALMLGVPSIGAIAIVTFIGAYVPYVGAWVAGAFAVLIALGDAGLEVAGGMVVIELLANGILQQLVQPLAYGAALGIHPLAVLVVTIAGGALFGMVGLVLAAPVASAVVRIVADVAATRDALISTADADTAPQPAPG